MSYTDEEFDALNQEYLENSGEELFRGNPLDMQRVSLADLKFSDNEETFYILKSSLEKKSKVSLDFKVEDGIPYYLLNNHPNKLKLYLNRQILNYLYSWFETGVFDFALPSNYFGTRNIGDNYVLQILKRDRHNGRIFHSKTFGYSVGYRNSIFIYYGNSLKQKKSLSSYVCNLSDSS